VEIYLTDLEQAENVDGVLRSVFLTAPPTRTVVGVNELPGGAQLAINAIAARGGRRVVAQGVAGTGDQSPAIQVGSRLFLSGRAGTSRDGVAAQVREVMDDLGLLLQAAGMGFSQVVKGKVYLTDMDDYAAMNEAYGSYFTDLFPTRSCIEVGSLPGNAKVAIALTADASPRR
jgi:2-iminobutanoate/2-iminopropanoate deaminase